MNVRLGQSNDLKVLDWKIQYDLTSGKTIQYEAVGRVLDCSPQVRSLGFSIQQFFSLWIGIPTLYGNKLARNIISCAVLKNLAQQICYHHVGMTNTYWLNFPIFCLFIQLLRLHFLKDMATPLTHKVSAIMWNTIAGLLT